MRRVVVIGAGPAALRAAAWLAHRGAEVRYLGVATTPAGVPPEPRWEPGLLRVEAVLEADLSAIMGPIAAAGSLRRGLWTGSRAIRLPTRRRQLVRAVGVRALPGVLRRHLEPAASYRDAIVARVGERIHDGVFAPWAFKRFATSTRELSAAAALQVHRPRAGRAVVPVWEPERVHAARIDAILEAGGEVLDGVEIEGLEFDGDRVVAVATSVGREHVADGLVLDVAPTRLAGWLPPSASGLAAALGDLRTAHAVQVTVGARADALPHELHVVDPARPFWALTRPGLLPGGGAQAGRVTAHLTLGLADPLWAADDHELAGVVRDALAGLAAPDGSPAVVRRLPRAVGVPMAGGGVTGTRLRELLDLAGIVPVGGATNGRFVPLVDDLSELRARFDGLASAGRPRFPSTPLDFALG